MALAMAMAMAMALAMAMAMARKVSLKVGSSKREGVWEVVRRNWWKIIVLQNRSM